MNALDTLVDIDWFANVGKPIPRELGEVVPVSNWREACDKCSDVNWEEVCSEARNDLTMHLNAVCKAEFQNWNKVINQIKQDLRQPWQRLRQFLDDHDLPAVIADCAEWDTMHAVATEHYAQSNPPQFFSKLLVVYQHGRFPCGWNGRWPEGTIFVY